MPERNTPRIEEKEGLVVMLDLLGTKGMWLNEDPSEIIDKWNLLIKSLRALGEDLFNVDMGEDLKIKSWNIKAFSDTIIMTFEGKIFSYLLYVVAMNLMRPFNAGFFAGMRLRGCISYGTYYDSDTIMIGPAVDDAAEWYEKFDWIGVSLTPSTSKLHEKDLRDGEDFETIQNEQLDIKSELGYDLPNLYIKYKIPMKKKKSKELFTLAWPNYINITMKNPVDDDKQISRVMGSFELYPIPPNAKSKETNTLFFVLTVVLT